VTAAVSARSQPKAAASKPAATPGPAEPGWLAGVRLRAARRVLWLRQLWSAQNYGDEHLLAISHSEVDRTLAPRSVGSDAEQAFYSSDERARELTGLLAVLGPKERGTPIEHLADTFGLGPMEVALLTLGLAAAADHAIARVFGYLLDDTQAADPTPALAASLFSLTGHPPPRPGSPLLTWLLAAPVTAGNDTFAWAGGWRADATLLPALAGKTTRARRAAATATDWSCGATGRVVTPPEGQPLRAEALAEITGFVRALGLPDSGHGMPIEIELVGAPGSGRTTLAAYAAAGLGTRLLAVDAARLAASPDPVAAATREVRRARLEGAAIAWRDADAIPAAAWDAVPASPLAFICLSEQPSRTSGYRTIRRSVTCGPISRRDRIALWSVQLPGPPPAAVADWALRPAEIGVAARVAPAGDDEVAAVCRRLLLAGTPDLATPMPLPYEWADLVLPEAVTEHLREFEVHAARSGEVLDDWGFARLTALGRGVTALFAGPSGTGKTMAAQVLARSLGLDLYRVDLAGVVSKYIGETEKHLRELFEACERAPVLLLFDEADALFGKRTQVTDAHDRYANIEIDYVLQRMERFDGVAVLATNRKGDLDPAFVRRIRFIVDFTLPGPQERERLWRIALDGATGSAGQPLTAPLDWQRLAADYDLTGAGIKSVALSAAFLAASSGGPITERHVHAAARRELAKQGVVVRDRPEQTDAAHGQPGEKEPR
jgi:AAA+ superfamily predicted ATPase